MSYSIKAFQSGYQLFYSSRNLFVKHKILMGYIIDVVILILLDQNGNYDYERGQKFGPQQCSEVSLPWFIDDVLFTLVY